MDRIDQKILTLLQQRTRLATQIGQAKRRNGAPVYAPEREAELFASLAKRNRGPLPAPALAAIYREIISSSRQVQGQAPIGVLKASGEKALLPVRWHFGACDRISLQPDWPTLARRLEKGTLVLGLLTAEELAQARLVMPKEWAQRFEVIGKLAEKASHPVFFVIRARQPRD